MFKKHSAFKQHNFALKTPFSFYNLTFCFRALETLQEIQKQKNSIDSKIQGAAVGKRRKTKRSIQFEKIENDIANYKVMHFMLFYMYTLLGFLKIDKR